MNTTINGGDDCDVNIDQEYGGCYLTVGYYFSIATHYSTQSDQSSHFESTSSCPIYQTWNGEADEDRHLRGNFKINPPANVFQC